MLLQVSYSSSASSSSLQSLAPFVLDDCLLMGFANFGFMSLFNAAHNPSKEKGCRRQQRQSLPCSAEVACPVTFLLDVVTKVTYGG